MTCLHCTNADPSLIEDTKKVTRLGEHVYYCVSCSKEWAEPLPAHPAIAPPKVPPPPVGQV